MASSLRDAPYAGLFVVFYEGIKGEACMPAFLQVELWMLTMHTASVMASTSLAHSAAIHTLSAASAGAIATMATHPFDVIKV
jgi:solute carrier family 25 protein 38